MICLRGGSREMEMWQLQQLQSLPLEVKIEKTKLRIKEWYEHWDGQVYVSFSGGKDSTVLLHLVRSTYPDVEAVFSDTGLEFPEIKEFVRSVENVTWLKPKMGFRQVIEKCGYPVISKEQSQKIREARTTKSEKLKILRINGKDGKYGISEKWKCLINAPFKISDQCCKQMKKTPFKLYEKQTRNKPFIGTMTEESDLRQSSWLRFGCNAFETRNPTSTPLSFWLESDIWKYIKQYNLPYSKIYDMGYKRTGCIFCMFGCHLEKGNNRFQQLEITHPQLHAYCMKPFEEGGLGIAKVLDYIKVPYRNGQTSIFDKDIEGRK